MKVPLKNWLPAAGTLAFAAAMAVQMPRAGSVSKNAPKERAAPSVAFVKFTEAETERLMAEARSAWRIRATGRRGVAAGTWSDDFLCAGEERARHFLADGEFVQAVAACAEAVHLQGAEAYAPPSMAAEDVHGGAMPPQEGAGDAEKSGKAFSRSVLLDISALNL